MKLAYRARTVLRAVVLFALVSLTITDAQAQYFGRNKVQHDDFDFESISTAHYDIYFYPEEEQMARDAARMAERWYSIHSATFFHSYDRKPLIFYANDADFQQTNVIEGVIGQGVGGVTESLLDRVVMPFTGIYEETDHVLGHELVHTFQYDIVQGPLGGGLQGLTGVPLWLIEGMAEYLSIGRYDPHTAMWMRDAVLRDELPTIDDLSDPQFFPYRYGQALMAFIAGRYGGNRAVADLFTNATLGDLNMAFTMATGVDADSLSVLWHQELRSYYTPLLTGRDLPENSGRRVLAKDVDAGDMNIAPALSPDGRYVAFISELDLFDFGIFLADTRTGRVIKRLTSQRTNPHFDAIRFINSAGTWSPDGRRFAFVTFAEGDNKLEILDVQSREVDQDIKIRSVGAIQNPTWSPDGRYIAFSGLNGGISDLYLYDVQARTARKLTNDRYADIHPDWSPDGRTIVWATDRGPGGTDFETLQYAPMRLGFLDVASLGVRVSAPFERAKHINPQFATDGRSVFFISDPDGFSNVYRMDIGSGEVARVTNVATGVSGITDLAPALSVADDTGLMMYSVFSDNNYTVYARDQEQTQGTPVAPLETALAGMLPPAVRPGMKNLAGRGMLESLPQAPRAETGSAVAYRGKLRLAAVGQPSVGVGYSSWFGAGIAGGVSLLFSDLMGNHLLGVTVSANGTLKDIGGQAAYLNRKEQLNWGGQMSHIPYLTGGTIAGYDEAAGMSYYEQILQRVYVSSVEGIAQYPVTPTRRFEGAVQLSRIASDVDVTRLYVNEVGQVVRRVTGDIENTFDPLYLVSGAGAYVGDYSFFGFTSPIWGGRYRFEAGYTVGTHSYGLVRADYRRYYFFNPITVAFSGYHVGRYGLQDDELDEFYPLNLGYSTYNLRGVHGYGINSFESEECARESVDECEVLDRVIGDRIAVAAVEIRVPLFGTREFGLVNFPYLPTELAGFFDAGLAWSGGDPPDFRWSTVATDGNLPVFSTGVAARFNLLGYLVLETFYAYPFQRPDKKGYFGLVLMPGW